MIHVERNFNGELDECMEKASGADDQTEQDHTSIIADEKESKNRLSATMNTWLVEIRLPAETAPPVELP